MGERRISSELLEVECLRTLDRAGLQNLITRDEYATRQECLYGLLGLCELVSVDRRILRRASEPLPVPLGTLDAIHLASALAWQDARRESIVMATHDKALARAAKAYGLEVAGI